MQATINLATTASSVRFSSTSDNTTKSRRRAPICAVASPAAVSLYEVLRVEHNASPTEIKSAFRSLAKIYHPDVAVWRSPESDGAGEFIEIMNAYETLSDPSARAMYDLSLFGRRLSKPLSAERSCSGYYQTRRWETDQCW